MSVCLMVLFGVCLLRASGCVLAFDSLEVVCINEWWLSTLRWAAMGAVVCVSNHVVDDLPLTAPLRHWNPRSPPFPSQSSVPVTTIPFSQSHLLHLSRSLSTSLLGLSLTPFNPPHERPPAFPLLRFRLFFSHNLAPTSRPRLTWPAALARSRPL